MLRRDRSTRRRRDGQRKRRRRRLRRSLSDFFEGKYLPTRLADASSQTVRQYRIIIRQLSGFLGRNALLGDLTGETIGGFLRSRSDAWSRTTYKHRRAELLALSRFAFEEGLIRRIPRVKPAKAYRPLSTAWTVDEISRIIHAAGEETGRIAGIRADQYWPALIQLLYWTGCRIGAALAIRCADVDLAAGTVLVRAETQKHGADQRFRLPAVAIEALAEIWPRPRELLFPWSGCHSALYGGLCRILRRAGLPTTHRDKFQRFRRTTATLCKQHGADPTAQLGHSSDAVTRRHYLAPDVGPQAADVLPDPTAPPADDRPPPGDGEVPRLRIYRGA